MPIPYWHNTLNSTNTSLPIVSCIMPTANRQEFLPKSIKYFLEQDYPYKEIVIVDDGAVSNLHLLPNLYSIRYFYSNTVQLIGAKRNFACKKAIGSIIMHWDDDDWYAPDWITFQVNTLLKSGADICGLNHIEFYSLKKNKFYIKKNTNSGNKELTGATLAYKKSFWIKHPFMNIQIGEDLLFVQNTKARIVAHHYVKGFLAIVHSTNARIRDI